MTDFLAGILSGDLSQLSIVDDNAKVSPASRMKACSSFGKLDEVHSDEVRKDRWSRLTRQEKDSSLILKTKRPTFSASSSGGLGERSRRRVSSESSISCPKRMESPGRGKQKNNNASWNSYASWDNEESARFQKSKPTDSMLCFSSCPKRMESPGSQRNNGKNAIWENQNIAEPIDAMLSILNLKEADLTSSARQEDGSGMSSMTWSRSPHNDMGRSGAGMMSGSSHSNTGGMTRSSNTFGGSSAKTKSIRSALGSMAPTSTMKRSSSKAPSNPTEKSGGGNATFKTYKVPSKSSLLYSNPGA